MKALAPHRGALLALALFLVVGLAILDDYGVAADEPFQRQTAEATLGYLANGGLNDFLAGLSHRHNKFYGAAFEASAYLFERAFGLEDSRSVWLSRHLLIHLFFLTGGVFAYLLARRLFGARLLALFAMLLFLLHPRLYAHSFFNSKDIPFLVAFIIALYLAHRAFKRDTLLAFALLGVGVGIAVNLRIMGVVLLASIPALRALDLAFTPSWRERERILLSTGAFALASLLTIYALLPYLWADPIARAVEWWTTLSDHPYKPYALFRGLLGRSVDFPEYVTTWFSITSPPFALLLGLVGAAFMLFWSAKSPRKALRNTRFRFGLLLAGCFTLPIIAVILLDANIYQGWRHGYFLWAPFALLAAWGLHGVAGTLRLRLLRAAVYAAAGAGLAATVISMALIHPNEQAFFNFSVDRVQPNFLRTQYHIEHWGNAVRQGFEWLLQSDAIPSGADIAGRRYWPNRGILPNDDREKISWNPSPDAFVIRHVSLERPDRAVYSLRVYNNTIMTIERKTDLRAVYAATQGRAPDVAGAYDAHRLDDAVALVMEPCAPSFLTETAIILRATPDDPADLPPEREGKRFEPLNFRLVEYGAFFDGKCVASIPLPDYPVADFDITWLPELLDGNAARGAARRAEADGLPLGRAADGDVYLTDGELTYVKESCESLDVEPVFYLDAFPVRASDLPQERRERGFERFHFRFHRNGALFDGACAAFFPLPNYSIAAVRIGQYVEGGDDLWQAAFSANPERYQAVYRAAASSEPLAHAAFDIHLLDGDLVYVKEPCEPADTEARFFLHIVPEHVSDLPEERREFGFDNLDFRFFLSGARFDGKCAAQVALPDYPIASVRTGQYVGGEGETWSAAFAVGR